MRASFAILALTGVLMLVVTFVYGLAQPSDAVAFDIHRAKHVILAVVTILYVCFVHVLAYTYFVVCARMAKDAVDKAGLCPDGYQLFVAVKRHSIRWLAGGVIILLVATVLGALAAPPASVHANWHLAAAIIALLVNPLGFFFEFQLITRNTILTEQLYASLPPHSAA